jgi:hypothetical protein
MCDESDWDRWHDLLTIRDHRAFTQDEQAEYDRLAQIVARVDAEAAAIGNAAIDALAKKHERVLASIERLLASLEWLRQGRNDARKSKDNGTGTRQGSA